MTKTSLPRATAIVALTGAAMLGACNVDDGVEESATTQVQLSAAEHLARASLALRGVRPSVEDLERVTADPAALESIVDGYLATPEFGKIMRDLHDEALLMRIDWAYYPSGFPNVGTLAGVDPFYLNGSVEEAPLRLVEHVIMSNRPYTEIVTADYTLANGVVAAVWGNLGYDPDGAEWQQTRWTDGRARAGLLSDPWIFTRYQSTPSNANRGRANAISKALLCYDFLSRDIEIDSSINLADPAVVANAVVDNPACASCHQGLDPLASFFSDYFPIIVPSNLTDYPFDQFNNLDADDPTALPFYFPGLFELIGIDLRERAFFGEPGADVADLGRMMAADPRFSLCAAKRFYAYFHQLDVDDVQIEQVAALQGTFVGSGFSAKALAKAVVLADDFAVSHSEDEAEATDLVGVKKLRPEHLSSALFDLTGFRWQTMRITTADFDLPTVDLLSDSFLGFRVLGGGIDAQYVTSPAHTFNATSALLLQAAAAESAAHVVASDFAQVEPGKRVMFRVLSSPMAGETEVRAQLAWLHKRLFSEMVDASSAEVNETYGLYAALVGYSGDPTRAWEGTLTAMLQDVRFATY